MGEGAAAAASAGQVNISVFLERILLKAFFFSSEFHPSASTLKWTMLWSF